MHSCQLIGIDETEICGNILKNHFFLASKFELNRVYRVNAKKDHQEALQAKCFDLILFLLIVVGVAYTDCSHNILKRFALIESQES